MEKKSTIGFNKMAAEIQSANLTPSYFFGNKTTTNFEPNY